MNPVLKDLRFGLGLLRKRPFNCLIQVTNRCNMRCSFCDFWPNVAGRGEELTLDDYRRLSRELSAMGCFLVSIEGGEPFVRPDLVSLVEAFGARHLPCLFTNGWHVTADNARALYAAGLTHCSVSLDYPDAARHDAKRGLEGAFARAWNALDHLLAAAPRGSKQVHVMTVVMEDNWRSLDELLALTAARGVGHQLTLLSDSGFRRGRSDRMPPAFDLLALWKRWPHLRFFRDYMTGASHFLSGGPMPVCGAGLQTFNVDHVGNVSACIERIDTSYGNLKHEPLRVIHARMAADRAEVSRCQQCWTACRGLSQALSGRGSLSTWWDLATRMRSS